MDPFGREGSPGPFDLDSLEQLGPLLESTATELPPGFQLEDLNLRPASPGAATLNPPGTAPSSATLAAGPSSKAATRARAESLPPGLAGEDSRGIGGQEKARARNKKAQRTFRQRQKAKAQQQEEELATATSRISDLEEQVALLQQLLAADLGPASEEPSGEAEDTSSFTRIQASSSALQLEKYLLLVKERKLHGLFQRYQDLDVRGQPSSATALLPSANFPALDIADPNLARSGFTTTKTLHLQAQYHECLATAAPFCSDSQSAHGKHFQAVMGEAMALLVVFMECLPEQFLACQSISMLDRSTQMPPQAFENVKVASRAIVLSEEQLAAGLAIQRGYVQQVAACQAGRQEVLASLQTAASMPDPPLSELGTPNRAVSIVRDRRCPEDGHILQQEAYLHLVRSFVLHILTPFDAGLLVAASHPFLVEFGAIIQHILSGASS